MPSDLAPISCASSPSCKALPLALRQRSIQNFLMTSDTRSLHSRLSPYAPVFHPNVTVTAAVPLSSHTCPPDASEPLPMPQLDRNKHSIPLHRSLPSGPTLPPATRRKRTRKRHKSIPTNR